MKNYKKQEITIKEACMDAAIPAILIAGAKLTNEMGQALFPEGIPFFGSALIYACAVAAIFRAIQIVVHYFIHAYSEINSAIMVVKDSQTWIIGRSMTIRIIKSLYQYWKHRDKFSQKLMIIIIVIGLSLVLFAITERSVDLWLPPTYSAIALLFAYIFERESISQRQGTQHYWLAVLLIFCIIQICIGIGIVDTLHLGNANVWSEIWELIVHLPTIQFSSLDNLRLLAAMSLIYLIADNIYQRYAPQLINYTKNSKSFFNQVMPWCQKMPVLGMA